MHVNTEKITSKLEEGFELSAEPELQVEEMAVLEDIEVLGCDDDVLCGMRTR